jgi:hypothetical protein
MLALFVASIIIGISGVVFVGAEANLLESFSPTNKITNVAKVAIVLARCRFYFERCRFFTCSLHIDDLAAFCLPWMRFGPFWFVLYIGGFAKPNLHNCEWPHMVSSHLSK